MGPPLKTLFFKQFFKYATCTNFDDGSFECDCLPGFYGDGEYCTDYDECREECWPSEQMDINTWTNITERIEASKNYFYIIIVGKSV